MTSKRVNAVSPLAQLFFYKLISTVDDYGRYEADAGTLLIDMYGTALALRPGSVTEADIEAWLEECAGGRDPLLLIYNAKNTRGRAKRYLQVYDVNPPRAKHSTYPGPEAAIPSESLLSYANTRAQMKTDESACEQTLSRENTREQMSPYSYSVTNSVTSSNSSSTPLPPVGAAEGVSASSAVAVPAPSPQVSRTAGTRLVPPRPATATERDEGWDALRDAWADAGCLQLSDPDWDDGLIEWRRLSIEFRLEAVRFLVELAKELPADIPHAVRRCLAKNYLAKRMWQRGSGTRLPPVAPTASPRRADVAAKVLAGLKGGA